MKVKLFEKAPRQSVALMRKKQAVIKKKAAKQAKTRKGFIDDNYEYNDDNYFYFDEYEGIAFKFDGVEFNCELIQRTTPATFTEFEVPEATIIVNGTVKNIYLGEPFASEDFGDYRKLCLSAATKAKSFLKRYVGMGSNPIGLDRKQALKFVDLLADELELNYSEQEVDQFANDLEDEIYDDSVERDLLNREYYQSVLPRDMYR